MKNHPHLYYYEDTPFVGEEPTEKVYYFGKYGFSRDFKPVFEKAIREGCKYAIEVNNRYKNKDNKLSFFKGKIFGKVKGYEIKEEVKRDWLFVDDEMAVMPTTYTKNKRLKEAVWKEKTN